MKRSRMALGAMALAAPAAANDSVAEVRAGGLVLLRSSAIDMVSEDLFVSADEVRVRYVFRNVRGRARSINTTVAFPMPDRDLSEEELGDVSYPSGFETRVDGTAVRMRVERKALLGGKDHTALLAGLRVPVADDQGAAAGTIPEALDALTPAQQDRLVRLRLASWVPQDAASGLRRRLAPMWTIRETWYWDQAFPAGRDTLVEHRYRPGTGGSVGTSLVDPGFRSSAEARDMVARYCIDGAFLAAVDRWARRAGGEWPVLPEERIGYILTTGGNWRAPIGRFRLVVDKGAPENIVSFCGEDVRKVSPTRFEMRRTNWRPDRDLDILIVKPPAKPD
jgi:hypothetical protein